MRKNKQTGFVEIDQEEKEKAKKAFSKDIKSTKKAKKDCLENFVIETSLLAFQEKRKGQRKIKRKKRREAE